MPRLYYYGSILLSDETLGRQQLPSRQKQNYQHAIVVITNKNFTTLDEKKEIPCTMIHFWTVGLTIAKTTIQIRTKHHNQNIYMIGEYKSSFGVLGDIKSLDGYHGSFGSTYKTLTLIKQKATSKWGHNKIPYTHGRQQSYNCTGFVDDMITWLMFDTWSPRIEQAHKRYKLTT